MTTNPGHTLPVLIDDGRRERLRAICDRWKLSELALFGSAVRGPLRTESDVDVLIEFADGATPSLFDLNRISRELAQVFERPVDVVTRRGIEHGRASRRRDEILGTAVTVCGAA